MEREELVRLVRRITATDGTEAEQDALLELLEQNVPHPEVSDLIYYPPGGIELSAEEVVDRALAYQATPIGPCSGS